MFQLIPFSLLMLSMSPSAFADVPQAILDAMKDRQIIAIKTDGSEVPGLLVGIAPDSVTVQKADGKIVLVPRADLAELRGGEASTGASEVDKVVQDSELVLRYRGSPAEAFRIVRETMATLGGKIKKEDESAGMLEGSWRYGLNAFGLRVRAEIKTLDAEWTMITFFGHFVDAVDVGGKAQAKALEVTSASKAALGR